MIAMYYISWNFELTCMYQKVQKNRMKLDVAVIAVLEFDSQRKNIPISRKLFSESLMRSLFEWYTSNDQISPGIQVILEDID